MFKQLGGSVGKEEKERYSLSKHWNGKQFENISETNLNLKLWHVPQLLTERWRNRKALQPDKDLPLNTFTVASFVKDGTPKFAWFGHSAVLLQLHNLNLLIDPMFGPDASPIGPIRTKRFSKNSLDIIDKLPELDAILITHDHYDHLDLSSIEKLKGTTDTWLVALGVKRHLVHWGVPAEHIKEFDWWDEHTLHEVKLIFTPSRHFSGRGLTDRSKCLWGGWVFTTDEHRIYWSGDGGYGNHFKEIGEKLGPFEWGFMECGQYNDHWQEIHLHPEEAVKAAKDAQVKTAIPVHWAAFSLALHPWTEPAERFVSSAKEQRQFYAVPPLATTIRLGQTPIDWWWEELT